MSRNSQLHMAALVVVCLLSLGFVLGRCSSDNAIPQLIITEKRIPVEVRIPSVSIQKVIDTVEITGTGPDSAYVMGLIALRDSLRRELASRKIGVLFTLDTITPLRDTIQVTCDEIQRRVLTTIRFGARDTTIVYLDTTAIIPPKRSEWGLTAGIGAGFSLDNSAVIMRPAIFIGITRTIINF